MRHEPVRRNSATPLYRQARLSILSSITGGDLAPGDKLPSVTKLAAELGINRLTVRRAVEELTREGVLLVRQGAGTFVAEPRRPMPVTISLSPGQLWDHLRHELDAREHDYRDVLLEHSEDDNPDIRRELKMTRGKLCRLDSLLLVGGEPWMLSSSWVSWSLSKTIAENWHERVGPYAALEQKYSDSLLMVWRSFSAEAATVGDAEILDVPAGSPLLVREGLTSDLAGEPVLRTRRRARGDRFTFVLRYPRPDEGPLLTPATIVSTGDGDMRAEPDEN